MVVFVLGLILVSGGTCALAADKGVGVSADEALGRLMDGNRRYVEQKMGACGRTTREIRTALVKDQKPYAVILSCSDSRVPPEIIFDQTLGEIFVIRVAGNVPDPVVLGSIEYAVEHIGSPLIMVLGHERCGAVTAAVEAHGNGGGNIGAIVGKIVPAVRIAGQEAKGKSNEELVEKAVDHNIRLTAENIIRHSPLIAERIIQGKVKIVKAKYDLDDGTVVLQP
jgi:carbonic anhydrase